MRHPNNEKNLSIKLTRHEVIDLALLCGYHYKDAEKWDKLHNKLFKQLRNYDEKHPEEEES